MNYEVLGNDTFVLNSVGGCELLAWRDDDGTEDFWIQVKQNGGGVMAVMLSDEAAEALAHFILKEDS